MAFEFDVKFKADGHNGTVRVGAADEKAATTHVSTLAAQNPYDLALHSDLHPDDALKMHGNTISNPHVPDSKITPGRAFRAFEIVSVSKVLPAQLADFRAALEKYGFTVTAPGAK